MKSHVLCLKWALAFSLPLPSFNADLAEDIPALGTLARVSQQIVAYLTHKVCQQFFFAQELNSFKKRKLS